MQENCTAVESFNQLYFIECTVCNNVITIALVWPLGRK